MNVRKGFFERLFPFLAVLVFLLFCWQLWKEYNRPYLKYQKQFKSLLIQKRDDPTKPVNFEFGIRQRWIKALNLADRCETCHLGVDDQRFQDVSFPLKTHRDPDTHPFETFGCTVCHGGQGLATSFKDAHGPVGDWHEVVYHRNFMENSCSQCHGEYIQDHSPTLSEGILIFNEAGCLGCHEVKGRSKTRVGTPFDNIAGGIRPDWAFRWLLNPRDYLPQTKMPDYKFSQQEAADIARFLFVDEFVPREVHGSYDRGKIVFGESRCVSCHSLEGRGGGIAPDLVRLSTKIYPQRLVRILKDPHKMWPDTQMPDYGFSDQDIQDVATFMLDEFIDFELDDDQVARETRLVKGASMSRGRDLVDKYGCIGCHANIKEIKDRGKTGAELTRIGAIHIGYLDFGQIDVAPEHRTVPNWLYNKVKDPRLFKAGLKMPDYAFNDSEAEGLTTYLIGLEGKEVPSSYTLPLGSAPSDYAPQGAFGNVLEKYRCLTCHHINGRGGEMANDLSAEGSRVQKAWLQKYMKTPYAIRPILEERMPRFKIRDSEIEVVYAYFQTTLVDDRVEELAATVSDLRLDDPAVILKGNQLFYERYACDACHQINLAGGVIGPDLTHVGSRLRREWIVYYLHDPKAFLKRSVEPVYAMNDKEIEAITAFLLNPKSSG